MTSPAFLFIVAAGATGASGATPVSTPASYGQKVEVHRHLPPPPAIPVAPVRVVEGSVQRRVAGEWKGATAEFRLSPGESVRTGADALALITLPWMTIVIDADAVAGLTPSTVLSIALERGRIEQNATQADILKVMTPEAEVRGRGTVVVRRDDAANITRVSAVGGHFTVKTGRGMVALDAGLGAYVAAGQPPDVEPLTAAPGSLRPGADPAYVEKGKPARLAWLGAGPRYHVQVLSLDGRDVLFTREVEARGLEMPTRWLGTYQWRVSAIDDRGVEGRASTAGLFCVVEK